METLQEFTHITKAACYIIGGIVLLVFIPFWLFLTDREEKDEE